MPKTVRRDRQLADRWVKRAGSKRDLGAGKSDSLAKRIAIWEDRGYRRVRVSDEKGEVECRIELGEKIMGTPAISGGSLFLRSDQHLRKFAIVE